MENPDLTSYCKQAELDSDSTIAPLDKWNDTCLAVRDNRYPMVGNRVANLLLATDGDRKFLPVAALGGLAARVGADLGLPDTS